MIGSGGTPATKQAQRGNLRLTSRGIGLLSTAALLLAVGIRFSVVELVGLAAALLALALIALGSLGFTLLATKRQATARVGRDAPPRMICGDSGEITTTISAWRPLAGAFLESVRDKLAPALCASQAVVGSRRDGQQLVYRVTPAQTGRWPLGPVLVAFGDPFGIAKASQTLGAPSSLMVWPHTVALPVAGRLSSSGGTGSSLTPALDDATLRSYIPGDDLRRIHWPTSARRGAPMIRENEGRGISPVQVVVDPVLLHDDRFAEWVLEHAASLATSALAAGHPVRIVGSGQPEFIDCQVTGQEQLLNQIADLAMAARLNPSFDALVFPSAKRGCVTYALVAASSEPLPAALHGALSGTKLAVLVGASENQRAARLQATGWRTVQFPMPVAHQAALAALLGASTTGWKAAA